MLEPLPTTAWNRAAATHLLNRAGFGGTPAETAALAAMAPGAAVARLVNWEEAPAPVWRPDWATPDPNRGETLRALRQASPEQRRRLQQERNRERRRQLLQLQHGWLQRMVTGPHPFQEKLTLFWHGHFATSVVKVRDPYLMWRQNDLFRRAGAGSWRALLSAVTRDPAMLIWLDQAQSRPAHPNENFARELLELFTLGEGHYTERDVAETARALAGLTLDRRTQEPVFRDRLRVPGDKTVLGRTGPLGVGEVLDLIVAQPQADRFITGRLWTFLAGAPPTPRLQEALAEHFRAQGRRFRPFLQTVLQSRDFHDPAVMHNRIKSPVELLAGACRQLERPLPPAPACAMALRQLGQEPFNPPNVRGWEGGLAWINTNTLLSRHNLALLLVTGENSLAMADRGPTRKPVRSAAWRTGAADPSALFSNEQRRDPGQLLTAIEDRFSGAPFPDRIRTSLREYLNAQGTLDEEDIRGVLRLALCTPQFQLH
ncbi:MAG: DUF1800 domain-containing protein [Verrucomicrobia bacterium]|nr:DUF1800 domain-containing protein [Verrucomicrobiota bacterium]